MTLNALQFLELHCRHEPMLLRVDNLDRFELRLSLGLLDMSQIQKNVIGLIKHLIKTSLIL